jgi:pyruvate,water dikinase
MGLALLDVADVIRPHPEVVAYLQRVEDDGFLERLPGFEGGRVVRDAIQAWLDRYGMRGVGEIDITRPRWSEHPHAPCRFSWATSRTSKAAPPLAFRARPTGSVE